MMFFPVLNLALDLSITPWQTKQFFSPLSASLQCISNCPCLVHSGGALPLLSTLSVRTLARFAEGSSSREINQ